MRTVTIGMLLALLLWPSMLLAQDRSTVQTRGAVNRTRTAGMQSALRQSVLGGASGDSRPEPSRTSITPRPRPQTTTVQSTVARLASGPQTFVVTTTNDTGAGSLRRAIHDANANPGPDIISFNITGGLYTIRPKTPFEVITSPVVIDGTTQPGYSGQPIVQLDGVFLFNQTYDIGLEIDVAGCMVKGLSVTSFAGGIAIDVSGGDTVQSCYIGVDPTGMNPLPNTVVGLELFGPGNLIGGITPGAGNVISANARNIEDDGSYTNGYGGNLFQGNIIGLDYSGTKLLQSNGPVTSQVGIYLYEVRNDTIGGIVSAARNIISGNTDGIYIGTSPGASSAVIQGNYIGLDMTGTFAPGNTRSGIRIWAKNGNLIGGVTTSAGNVISGNAEDGIALRAGATGNLIEGNVIGTDASESLILGNGDGILVQASDKNTIGGAFTGEGNVIGGNKSYGVSLDTTAGTVIQGNLIGVVLTNGMYAPMGNDLDGIMVHYSPRNTIGGSTTGSANIIGWNAGNGITFAGDSAVQNVVQGNAIGSDITGARDLGNDGNGVQINGSQNIIGGTQDAVKNVISHNAATGVYVLNGKGNLISHNSMSSNGLLGIDIDPLGPNPNDPMDVDVGPNEMQNYPVLDSVIRYTSTTVVKGHLNSAPSASYTVDVYQNSARDTSGYGEGETFIGSTALTTDGSGNATFAVVIPAVLATGKYISSTATDNAGNTSEFSRYLSPLKIIRPRTGELWVTENVDTIRWETSGAIDKVTLRYSVDDGNTFQLISQQQPALADSFVWTIPPDILSKKCRVAISDFSDPTAADTSDKFKIKGYELTKDSADQFVRYLPERHGWSFQNDSIPMWPFSWYSQFDYQGGIDPNTNKPYPEEIKLKAKPSDFPNWTLFVATFGANVCYFLPTTIYKPSAIEFWLNHKRSWKGSCFGMALSSYLAFEDSLVFTQRFTDVGAYTQLSDFGISPIRRSEINRLQFSQFGVAHVEYRDASESKTPRQTLSELRQMLLDENRDDRVLILTRKQPSEAHAVNPFKVVRDLQDESWLDIEVYDNQDPGHLHILSVDSLANKWVYGKLLWGGTSLLYLSEPMSEYLVTPQLSVQHLPALPAMSIAAGLTEGNRLTLYTSPAAAVQITDSTGNAIGFADSSMFNTIPGANAIIPITGSYEPPIGYTLPAARSYSIAMQNFSDTTTHVALFADSLIFSYRRSGVQPTESDHFKVGPGFDISNHDNVAKSADLKSIIVQPDNEKVISLENTSIRRDDSLHLDVVNRKDLKITNTGDSLHYDLRVQQASAAQNAEFTHGKLVLPPNSSAQITPSWTNLIYGPMRILVDLGNDGSVDDSLFLLNDSLGWKTDRNENNPLCVNAATQEHPRIVTDGKGGSLITWEDGRGNGVDIFAQRLDASGRPLWAADGVSLCSGPGSQIFPVITTDMRGGAWVAWDDYRHGVNRDIFYQHVDSLGHTSAGPFGGPVCINNSLQGNPLITSDSLGGAFAGWIDNRVGYPSVFAQHLTDSGSVWTSDGVRISPSEVGGFSMIADGSGGVIIVWSESRTSGADIYAQRMSALGVPLWTTDGVLLCSNPSNKYYPVITRSAGQTWIVAWDDHRGPGGTDDIYAQCIDSSGSLLWSRDGVSLCTAPREQYRPQIAGDGNGGAIIVWTDNRNSPDSLNLTADLYAQRVGPSGTVQWATDGVAVTTAHNDQVNPVLAADDRGGAVIAWMDARSDTSYDIYAQRVTGSGLVDWAQDGIPVSTALHDQTSPCILDDGSGGAVVAWEDWRPWTNADIYGQHISHQGLLGPVTDIGPMENRVVQYELAQNYPNPFNPTTNIQYSLPKWSHVTIDIYNILGQKISTLVNEEQAPGQHTVTLNGTGLATGVYLCHMQAGPFAQTRKLLLLK